MSQAINTQSELAVCPHCALLCDDVQLERNADLSLRVRRNGCARARRAFAVPPAATQALVDGEAVTTERALDTAARLLRRTRDTFIGGLATDIDGIREAVRLAEVLGATLDHVNSDTQTAGVRVLQNRGWFATTLSEIRTRADLVLLVDVDFDDRYERFPERCLKGKPALAAGRVGRQVAYLGRRGRAPHDPVANITATCRTDGVLAALLGLLAGLRGDLPAGVRPGGAAGKDLLALVQAVQAANYCAVVFSTGMLAGDHEAILYALCDIVDAINEQGRGALLNLGGDNGGQSAQATLSWLTGYPTRVHMGRTIAWEPDAGRLASRLADNSVKRLLWIDAFGENPLPAAAPTADSVVIASARPARDVAVYLPIGIPGIDHFARLARADGAVTLPLHAQRDAGLTSAAAMLRQIRERL